MKKLICFLLIVTLTFSLMLSMTPLAFADESFTADPEVAERIFGLGLMPHVSKANYSPKAEVTRAELALILDTISGYKAKTENSDFTWQFYGDAYKEAHDLKPVPEGAKQRFEDVPVTYWAYNYVENVCSNGYMNGVSASSFAPEASLTVPQLAKTFVSFLGYDSLAKYYGGYPDGYMKVAKDLKLLKAVPLNGNVTNDILMHFIDNMLDVRLMEFDGIITEDNASGAVYSAGDETFLTGILGLGRVEGIMSDNSVTSLSGSSRVPVGNFVIDGTKFKAFEDIAGALYKLIGREVECYYVAGESKNFGYIMYAALTGEDEATVIDANDFGGYNNGVITYFDGDKVETIKLSSFYRLIYNGKVKTSFDKNIFDFEDGVITVVESESGTDVVLIEDYETWYLSAVDYDNSKIFNRVSSSLSASAIDFDDYDFVSITKADGTPGTIEDITADMVLTVCKNGNYVAIEICDDIVSGTITEVVNRDGDTYYGVADGEYKFSGAYAAFKDKNDMEIGTEVTLYLNRYGKIAWVSDGAYVSYKVGCVMDFDKGSNGFDSKTAFKIFDVADKIEKTFYAPKNRIRVSDQYGEETAYTDYDKFAQAHGSYRGIVRYSLNESGELNYIEYPITDLNYSKDNKLMLFADISDEYNKTSQNLGGKAVINSSSVVIGINPDMVDDEDGYSVKAATSAFSQDITYKLKCYTTKKNSKLAQYIIQQTATKDASLIFSYTSRLRMAIVKRVAQTYDDDWGSVKTIKAFGFTNQLVDTPADIDLILDEAVTIKTIMAHEFNHELEPGDIIAYGTNRDGHVTEIRVIWDESEPNPDSPYGISGMLTDSKGYYGSGADAPSFNPNNYRYQGDTTQMPNPYTIETKDGVDYGKNPTSFTTGPFSIQYGFIPRIVDGIMEITTQDLTVEDYDQYGVDGKHFIRVWGVPANAIFVTLSGKGDVEVTYSSTTALMDQIRTQDMHKDSCSRILTDSNGGALTRLVVINGQFD